MDKDKQENPKKEERKARRLARKLLISYVVQNPGTIRTIKENGTIFNSVSDFTDFILDEDNPKNLRFAQRTASFVEKNSDDLTQLSKLLSNNPNALKNVRIPHEIAEWFSTPHEEMNKFEIVGKLAQNVLGDQEIIESLACVSYFVTEEDTVSSFSSYLESHPDVPPLVATIRFIKENPAKAQTFMEFIEQDSIDIARIANFLRVPENAELSSALGLPKEGQKVVNFLAANSEQIQPAVSMIREGILKPALLNTAENVALFMDNQENQTALNNISDYILENKSELESYKGIAEFIEKNHQDLHKISELFSENTGGIVALAEIFQNPENAKHAKKMFNLSDISEEDFPSVLQTIANNENKLQAIAQSANNLLNNENSAVRSSLSEVATFMSNSKNEKLIDDFSKYMQTEKREGMSEPLAFIKYVKDNPENVSEFLNFVADKNDDISNIVSFTQTDDNKKLAETLGLSSDVTEIFSVLHENADKIQPTASLIKDQILNPDQRGKLLDSIYSITEYCTQQENIDFFKKIQSSEFRSVEDVTSFIDQNYDSAQKFIRFIGNNGEKIINLSQFAESNSDYINKMGLDAEEIKNITSYMNENPDKFKKAAKLASRVFEFDAEHKNVRKTITGFITNENNKKSIQNISQTISKLQEPFSLDGIEQLIDTNHKDLNNVLSFIETNHEDLVTLGAFLKENINYAPVFGLNETDAKGIKSFLDTLQENQGKIQPAAKFTQNLIDFYVEHPNCKNITSFYKQGDNAEQISNIINDIQKIDLYKPNPNYINSILDNQNNKKLLQQTVKLISNNSKDIIAFADFLSNKDNSELLKNLTGDNCAANIAESIRNNKEKLEPAANILCTALEFDSRYPGIRKSLLNLYEDVGREKLNEIINDFNNKSDWTEIVPVVKKHKNCAIKLIKWLESNKGSEKNIGNFINGHKDDIKQIFGTEPSELNKITGYMVSPPWWFKPVRKVVTKHPGAAIDVADFAADVVDGAEDVWNDIKNFFSDADISLQDKMKTDYNNAQRCISNIEYLAQDTKASTQQKNSNSQLDLIVAKYRDTYSA